MLQHDRFFVPQRQEKLQFCCAHLHGQAPRVYPSRLLWQESFGMYMLYSSSIDNGGSGAVVVFLDHFGPQ